MCTNWGGMTPDIERAVTEMPRQLAPATGGLTLRVESERQIKVTQSTLDAECAITVVREGIILRLHL